MIRLRDLIGALLCSGVGLSVTQASRVLEACAISPDHLRRRMASMPQNVGVIVDRLRHAAGPDAES